MFYKILYFLFTKKIIVKTIELHAVSDNQKHPFCGALLRPTCIIVLVVFALPCPPTGCCFSDLCVPLCESCAAPQLRVGPELGTSPPRTGGILTGELLANIYRSVLPARSLGRRRSDRTRYKRDIRSVDSSM